MNNNTSNKNAFFFTYDDILTFYGLVFFCNLVMNTKTRGEYLEDNDHEMENSLSSDNESLTEDESSSSASSSSASLSSTCSLEYEIIIEDVD